MIELKNISKVYKMGDQTVRALDDVSLTIKDGEYIAIIGPSGSGKSTLMNVLGCLDNPSSGQYLLNGKDVSKLHDDQLAGARNKNIGFVFQRFNLMGRISAIRNVEMPARYGGIGSRERNKRAVEALTSVGLGKRMNHTPVELSGGQQQRVAIARALVNQPNILLADEPTGALDSKTGREILDLFERLHTQRGITVIVVTHDPQVARRADRVVSIRDGRIESDLATATMPASANGYAHADDFVGTAVPAGVGQLGGTTGRAAVEEDATTRRGAALGALGTIGNTANVVSNADGANTDEDDTPLVKPVMRLTGRQVLTRGLIAVIVAAIVNVGLGVLAITVVPIASRLPMFMPVSIALLTIVLGLVGVGVFAIVNRRARQPVRVFRTIAAIALFLSFVPNAVAINNPTLVTPLLAASRQGQRTGNFGGQGQGTQAQDAAGATGQQTGQTGQRTQTGTGNNRAAGPFGLLLGQGTNGAAGQRGTGTSGLLTIPFVLLMVLHVVAYAIITGVLMRKPRAPKLEGAS